MIRRGITIVATIAAIGTFAALASAHPLPLGAHKAQTNLVTRTVSKPVKSAGVYLVVVTVRAHQHVESLTVYLSGAAKREIRASTHTATALEYHLTVSHTPAKLTARSRQEAVDRLDVPAGDATEHRQHIDAEPQPGAVPRPLPEHDADIR